MQLDWIPVYGRLCAIWLDGSVRINSSCLFVVCIYAPTNCSFPEAGGEFFRELPRLVRSRRSTDIVVVGDFKAYFGYLVEQKRHIGGRFPAPIDRTGNRNHLTEVCSLQRSFLTNTSFYHKRRHRLNRHLPSTSQHCMQIDQVAIGHQ